MLSLFIYLGGGGDGVVVVFFYLFVLSFSFFVLINGKKLRVFFKYSLEKNISLYLGEKMELKKLISKKIFFHFKILKGYIFKERKRKEQEKENKKNDDDG